MAKQRKGFFFFNITWQKKNFLFPPPPSQDGIVCVKRSNQFFLASVELSCILPSPQGILCYWHWFLWPTIMVSVWHPLLMTMEFSIVPGGEVSTFCILLFGPLILLAVG